MKFQKRIPLTGQLSLILQAGSGTPNAVRVDLRLVYRLVSILLGTFFFFIMGTLLFFRELEINDQLRGRVLELEITETLNAMNSVASPVMTEPEKGVAPVFPPKAALEATQVTPKLETHVHGRIGRLSLSCQTELCEAQVVLVPNGSGVAEGKLILVLETEIVRIGTATHVTEPRKRYFISPNKEGVDELDVKGLSQIPGKTFRFSKALQTTTSFQVEKTLKPTAVDAYTFDQNNQLVHHQRHVIESNQ